MNWMNICEQLLNLSIDYLTDVSYEWHKERVRIPDDFQHRLTELHKALGDVLTIEPTKTEDMVELKLTEHEVDILKTCLYARGILNEMTDTDKIMNKIDLALNVYYSKKLKEELKNETK